MTMLTNECLFAIHDSCSVPEFCDCLCHITDAEIDEFLDSIGRGEGKI